MTMAQDCIPCASNARKPDGKPSHVTITVVRSVKPGNSNSNGKVTAPIASTTSSVISKSKINDSSIVVTSVITSPLSSTANSTPITITSPSSNSFARTTITNSFSFPNFNLSIPCSSHSESSTAPLEKTYSSILALKKSNSLQQLNISVLPPYSPTLSSQKTKEFLTTTDTFSCKECGDNFLLESSLKYHLDRHSVQINFSCETCSKTMVLYNRCALLSHIRLHRENNEQCDIKKAVVLPLTSHAPSDTQDFTLSSRIIEEDSAATSPSKLLELTISETDQSLDELPYSPQRSNVEFRCPECNKLFFSFKARLGHLNNYDKVPLIETQCSKCKMVCPSKCSLRSHQRIHAQIGPYICPECGDREYSTWEQFQTHLKLKCMHFSRTVGYKCTMCNQLYTTVSGLQRHSADMHSETYYKCQSCPMAFRSVTTFNSHKRCTHATMNIQHKLIFKCALCEIVFLTGEQLVSHLEIHIKDQPSTFLFTCYECDSLYDSKTSLMSHLREAHACPSYSEVCLFCDAKFLSVQALENHKKYLHSFPKDTSDVYQQGIRGQTRECTICHRGFQSIHGYNLHWQRCHAMAFLCCPICGISTSDRSELVTHGKWHMSRGILLCLICNNKEFENLPYLLNHLKDHTWSILYPTACFHCEKSLLDKNEAFEHFKQEHSISSVSENEVITVSDDHVISPQPLLQNEPATECTFKCWICINKIFDKESSLKQHLFFVHKLPDSKIDRNKISQPTSNSHLKVTKENNYISDGEDIKTEEDCALKPMKSPRLEFNCARCGYKSPSEEEFQKHISKHKSDGKSFQCTKCGTCFVVKPSLRRHLVTIHKMQDVDKYLEELEHENVVSSEGKDVNNRSPLDCSVCFINFPNEQALNTHMRSHGMAFIKSKRKLSS